MRLPRLAVRSLARVLPLAALAVVAVVAWSLRGHLARHPAPAAPTPAAGKEDRSSPVPTDPATPAPAQNPHGNIRIACEACHTAESWTQIRQPTQFDHALMVRASVTIF